MFSLKEKHTLALNAFCQDLLSIQSVEELSKVKSIPNDVFILGGGSNVAFVEDFEGLVISFVGKDISIKEKDNAWLVEAEAGVNWHHLVHYLISKGIPGLENLALIPGNCGAAPVQNIGAYGVEFADYCQQVHAIDLRTREEHVFDKGECNFSYRNSMFKDPTNKRLLITKVVLKLTKLWKANLSYSGLDSLPNNVTAYELMNKVIELRNNKLPDPGLLANAGSFFKNPVIARSKAEELGLAHEDMPLFSVNDTMVKLSAGWLIEKAGFKGKSVNMIGTYKKHALVLVNYGNATGDNLVELVRMIRDEVWSMFNVKLENEVLLMGKNGLIEL